MYTTYKKFKVKIIGILEERDSFYWSKMHLWKGAKNLGRALPPKEQQFFSSWERPSVWFNISNIVLDNPFPFYSIA